MNSDSNSDSKQYTKSKLGRVHSAHTHGPGCTQAVRALRPGRRTSRAGRSVMARTGAVSWSSPTVSQRALAVSRAHVAVSLAPQQDTKFVSQHRPLPRAVSQGAGRRIAVMSRAVSRRQACPSCHNTIVCIVTHLPAARCIATQKVASQPQYNICIATHPLARSCAHALPHALARGSTVSWPLLVVLQEGPSTMIIHTNHTIHTQQSMLYTPFIKCTMDA